MNDTNNYVLVEQFLMLIQLLQRLILSSGPITTNLHVLKQFLISIQLLQHLMLPSTTRATMAGNTLPSTYHQHWLTP